MMIAATGNLNSNSDRKGNVVVNNEDILAIKLNIANGAMDTIQTLKHTLHA